MPRLDTSLKSKVTTLYLELHGLHRDSHDEKILTILREGESLMMQQQYEEAQTTLKALDDTAALFQKLEVYLKGKPVYKTLKKITKGTIKNEYETVVGLSSLCTHLAIACKDGHTEYVGLLREMNFKVTDILNAMKYRR